MSGNLVRLMPVRDFIRLVWRMREAQCTYFAERNQSNLVQAKSIEKKVDQALMAYLEVMDRKHQTASLGQPVETEPEQPEQASLPTLEVHKQGKLPL